MKYEITILNWDKYQREMKGGENRRRRREWVAVSVDLFSDPDYLEMNEMHRNAWLAMLCHAGKVGPVFELRPSDARLLFRLRRSPDFEVFKNQGFIDLRAATNKTNKTNKTNSRASAKKKKKSTPKTTARFDDFWAVYPKRKNKPDALKAWQAGDLDSLADVIIPHVEKRKAGDEQWTKDGGTYIPYPASFLRGQMWTDEWEPIVTSTPIKHRKPEVITDEQRRLDRIAGEENLKRLQRMAAEATK